MQHGKRALIFLSLIAIAVGLGAFNVYLWQLQAGKKQVINGLQSQVELHQKENKLLSERNRSKGREVETLRSPDSYYLYEEKAREDYGMIGQNETFFVLTRNETQALPDIAGLEHAKNGDDIIAIPSAAQQRVITLESIVEPPSVSPEEHPEADELPAAPLQLESLQ